MTETQRASCIVGWPAKHSRSPKLHGYWIKKYGLDADYRCEEIETAEAFTAFVQDLPAHGYVGCNVTIPHKENALAAAVPDARAKAVGAANTLWWDNGTVRCTNTDVDGFLLALDATAPGWDQRTKEAVVLGAGGGGRGIVYGLLERGFTTVHLVNRTLSRAEAIRDQLGSAVCPATWDQVPALLRGCKLLANATSLGMQKQPPLEIDLSPMADGGAVMDAVYVPLKTELLRQAEARGLKIANGLHMLLYQAVPGFERWFGVRPEVTQEQFDLLAADIAAS